MCISDLLRKKLGRVGRRVSKIFFFSETLKLLSILPTYSSLINRNFNISFMVENQNNLSQATRTKHISYFSIYI